MIATIDNLETKLRYSQINFESNGGYNQNALLEVYAYYKEYLATGKYPYTRMVAEYIQQKESIDNSLLKHLETQVYLASKQHKAEQDKQYEKEMICNGWERLTPLTIEREYKNHNKIEVSATIMGAIFSSQLTGIFKPFVNDNGDCYIMKLRATRKGYIFRSLENPFYKVVTK